MGCGNNNPNPLDSCSRALFQCNNPCNHTPGCDLLPTQIDTFATQFFGNGLGKVNVGGNINWALPCGLDTGTLDNPRLPGESLACYFLRLFEAGIPGTIGPVGEDGAQGATGSDAFSATAQEFFQPTLAQPYVTLKVVPSPSILQGLFVEIENSGFYLISDLEADGSALLQLLHPFVNAPSVIPVGSLILPSGVPGINVQGPKGPKGDQGAQGGQRGNTLPTLANFTKPALNGTVIISVQIDPTNLIFNSAFVKIAGDGYKILTATPSTGILSLKLVDLQGAPGVVPAGTTVFAVGPQGPQGGQGATVSLQSGIFGYTPFNNSHPAFPTLGYLQSLTANYLPLTGGGNPSYACRFTTPDASASTYFLMFRIYSFVSSGNPITGKNTFKIVGPGGDESGSIRVNEVAGYNSTVLPSWTNIPLIVTNNTGIITTWTAYGKTNMTGAFQSAAVNLGPSGVSWTKIVAV